MLSGSMAMTAYTEPRFTKDFDFVVHLKPTDIPFMINFFKEGYYYDEQSMIDATKHNGMFNIIDHKSNYKADFVILKDEPFRQMEFKRRRKIDFLDGEVYVVSAEDLFLSKLIWIQELQSPLQIEDLKLLWKINDLDREYIRNWINTLKLNTFDLLME